MPVSICQSKSTSPGLLNRQFRELYSCVPSRGYTSELEHDYLFPRIRGILGVLMVFPDENASTRHQGYE